MSVIINKLKGLERDAVQTFLKKFEIKQIRELKPEQIDGAIAFIETLGGDRSEEVDPFA